MTKTLALSFLFFLLLSTGESSVFSQPQTCRNTICFASKVSIGNQPLPLKNIVLLEYLRMDVYTAALYTPTEIKTAGDVLRNIPKSLILHYHRPVKKEWILKASHNRLKKNLGNNISAFEERLKTLDAAYQSVKKNDRYELRYEPSVGTSLFLNDKLQVSIPGEDFQQAYFGIWFSEKPLNKKFRDKLLKT